MEKSREQLPNDGSRGRKEAYMRNMVKFTAASVCSCHDDWNRRMR
jgi:hypothetical protein